MKKIYSLVASSAIAFAALSQTSTTFNYTGAMQTFIVPGCVTSLTVDCSCRFRRNNKHIGNRWQRWPCAMHICRYTWRNTANNVGVGTKSPTERFQVNGGNILVKGTDNFSANGNTATLFLGDNNNYIRSTFGGGVSIGVFQYPDLVAVDQNGSVGIGTVNIPDPNYKLSVNGSIRTKRIIVETGWSDFVFKPDYKLMSFEELEN